MDQCVNMISCFCLMPLYQCLVYTVTGGLLTTLAHKVFNLIQVVKKIITPELE